MRDIVLGDTFYEFFTTRQFSDGVPTLLAGSPVLSVIEENNGTPITAGGSIQVSRGSVVGLNQATIIASGGNGYSAGASYAIFISTGTVGGDSVVGEVVGRFTIEASAAAVDLANGTDGLTALAADIAAAQAVLDGLQDISAADVNAQMLDVLNVDTFGEPAQGAFGETETIIYKLSALYKVLVNEKQGDATGIDIYNFAATVVDHKRVVDKTGSVYTEENIISGP
jgi:hypothetical protein